MSDGCAHCEARGTTRAAITTALAGNDWTSLARELTVDAEIAAASVDELIRMVCHLIYVWSCGIASHRGGEPEDYLSEVWRLHILAMEAAEAAE